MINPSDPEIRARLNRLKGRDIVVITATHKLSGNLRRMENDLIYLDDYGGDNGQPERAVPIRWYVRLTDVRAFGEQIRDALEIPQMPGMAKQVAPPQPVRAPLQTAWILVTGSDAWHAINMTASVGRTLCDVEFEKCLTMRPERPLDGEICKTCANEVGD